MDVLVTGASGHVGGNLVRLLLARGHRVRVTVYRDTRGVEGLDVERVEADVTDLRQVRAALDGVEVVFHAAAHIGLLRSEAPLMQRVNVEGTRHVVEAARDAGVRRLLHFSSVHALRQEPTVEPLAEDRPLALQGSASPYDRTKAEAEQVVLEAAAAGLDAVVVNPGAVIGPFDLKPSYMGEVLLLLATGRLPGLVRTGYTWVDARDVAAGALAAAERGRSGERYLLTGPWASFVDLADIVASHRGLRRPRLVVPLWVARASAPFSLLWARIRRKRPLFTPGSLRVLAEQNPEILHHKAARELGFAPRPIEETVRAALDGYVEAGMLPPARALSRPEPSAG